VQALEKALSKLGDRQFEWRLFEKQQGTMGHERVIAFQVAPGARVLSASALCWPGAYPKATRARSTDLVLQQRSLSGDRGRVPCPHALALTHACAGADVRRRRGVPARRWLLPALPRHAGPAPAPRTLSARRARDGSPHGWAAPARVRVARCMVAGTVRGVRGGSKGPPPPLSGGASDLITILMSDGAVGTAPRRRGGGGAGRAALGGDALRVVAQGRRAGGRR
jgi:hypothetical protein